MRNDKSKAPLSEEDDGRTFHANAFSKPNLLKEKSFGFALRIIKLNQYLIAEHREFVLSKQVLRSGTSIGANIEEAFQGQSRLDFINKLSIANKEAFETNYWLRLLRESSLMTSSQADSLLRDCVELQKMLVAAIKTSKAKM
jgi:four helix bundle protein